MEHNLLNIDTSYTLEFIEKTKLYEVLNYKNLDNFFTNVWTVHPVASLTTSKKWSSEYGKFSVYKVNNNNYFIEGKFGRYKILRYFKVINFIISQYQITKYLIELIKKENIKIIKSNDINYCGVLSLVLKYFTNVKVIVRVGSNNDKIYEVTKKPMQKKLFVFRFVEKFFENLVLKKADFVIGANQNNLNFALQNGASLDKSDIVRYGSLIDNYHYKKIEERQIEKEFLKDHKLTHKKFILYIGRLEKVKHTEDVIIVLNKITKINDDFKALILGEGSEYNKLIDLIKKLKLEDKVVLAGNKSQKFISNIIISSSIIISPHTGRALCEVSLGGGVVVGYDIDWQSELIKNNYNGYIVKYRDVDELGEKTLDLINDEEKQKIFSKNNRDFAINLLDKNKIVLKEKNIISSLIK